MSVELEKNFIKRCEHMLSAYFPSGFRVKVDFSAQHLGYVLHIREILSNLTMIQHVDMNLDISKTNVEYMIRLTIEQMSKTMYLKLAEIGQAIDYWEPLPDGLRPLLQLCDARLVWNEAQGIGDNEGRVYHLVRKGVARPISPSMLKASLDDWRIVLTEVLTNVG